MRPLIFAVAAIACGGLFLSMPAEAKSKRTVVTIPPHYLTAGSLASPYEYRGVMPKTDVRFLPVTSELPGRVNWDRDPWLVPYKRSSFSMDFDGMSGQRRYHRYGY